MLLVLLSKLDYVVIIPLWDNVAHASTKEHFVDELFIALRR